MIDEPSAEMLRLSGKLSELCKLETGWDGYNAGPVKTQTAQLALDIARRLEDLFPTGLQAVPGSSGDVQLELHTKNFEIEIWIVTN